MVSLLFSLIQIHNVVVLIGVLAEFNCVLKIKQLLELLAIPCTVHSGCEMCSFYVNNNTPMKMNIKSLSFVTRFMTKN